MVVLVYTFNYQCSIEYSSHTNEFIFDIFKKKCTKCTKNLSLILLIIVLISGCSFSKVSKTDFDDGAGSDDLKFYVSYGVDFTL